MSTSIAQSYAAIFGAYVPADVAYVRDQIRRSPLSSEDREAALLAAADRFAGQTMTVPIASPSDTQARSSSRPMDVQSSGIQQARRTSGDLEAVISLEKANALFRQIAYAPDIPHTFVHEGCHERAHIAAKRIEQEGVYSEKAWLRTSGADLQIDTSHSPLGYTIAIFHCAVAVHVDEGWGQTARYVIDPSLFDEPVPVETWSSKMRALDRSKTEITYTARFVHHIRQLYEDPPTSWREVDLAVARTWNRDYKTVAAQMADMGFDAHLQELVAQAHRAYGAA